MEASDNIIDVQDSNVSWGYLKDANGGASNTRRIVINDEPTIPGMVLFHPGPRFAVNVKEVCDVVISINGGGVMPESWEYSFTLQRLEGEVPIFRKTELKSIPYQAQTPQW
jgi:hypothetical protein